MILKIVNIVKRKNTMIKKKKNMEKDIKQMDIKFNGIIFNIKELPVKLLLISSMENIMELMMIFLLLRGIGK